MKVVDGAQDNRDKLLGVIMKIDGNFIFVRFGHEEFPSKLGLLFLENLTVERKLYNGVEGNLNRRKWEFYTVVDYLIMFKFRGIKWKKVNV